MQMKPGKNLFSILTIDIARFLSAILCAFVVTVANIALKGFCGSLADRLGREALSDLLIPILLVFLLSMLFGAAGKYTVSRIGGRTSEYLYTHVTESIGQSTAGWLDKQTAGDATTIFTEDIPAVCNYVKRILEVLIPDSFLFVLTFGYMTFVNFRLAVISAAAALIPLLVLRMSGRAVGHNYTRVQEATVAANQVLDESLCNMEMAKACAMEDTLGASYTGRLREVNRANTKMHAFDALTESPTLFCSFVMVLVTAAYGGCLVNRGDITIGTLLSILMLTDYILDPVMKLSGTLSVIRKTQVNWRRINHYLSAPGEIYGNLRPKSREAALRLNHVTFSYDARQPLLTDCSLSFHRKKHYFIVGPIGTGKSTILKLLSGIYRPEEGEILLNGVPMSDCDEAYLRDHVTVVPQKTELFGGTILENLLPDDSGISSEEVWQVCKALGIHDEIMAMPEQYYTRVGEGGYGLSGGQQQRLAVARGILRHTEILLLDEPSSALDADNRALLGDCLAKLDKTVIVVTHDREMIDKGAVIYDLGVGR